MIPFSLASLPIAAISWIVPISLFAYITEIRIVLSVSAWRIASSSTRPSGRTGTYVTSKPWRSRRLQTSRLARCSIAVVTMWLPFSRYISATPLRARLMASVPPEVNTSSLGSRAPISFAICSRALSTPPSASQPKGWLRLAGCPNFSVKYGIISSRTRGSTGVVDWLSMKIGSFNAIAMSLLVNARERHHRDGGVGRQLRERHAIEYVRDAGLDLLHRTPQVAARELRAIVVFGHAAHHAERPLERPDHLAHRDRPRPARQHIAALGPVVARDELLLRELLEDLGEPLRRDAELLGDALGAHRSVVSVGGDEVDRHQPVVRPLRESQHACPLYPMFYARLLYPTFRISDPYGRTLPPGGALVKVMGILAPGAWPYGGPTKGARLRARRPGTAWRPPRAGCR